MVVVVVEMEIWLEVRLPSGPTARIMGRPSGLPSLSASSWLASCLSWSSSRSPRSSTWSPTLYQGHRRHPNHHYCPSRYNEPDIPLSASACRLSRKEASKPSIQYPGKRHPSPPQPFKRIWLLSQMQRGNFWAYLCFILFLFLNHGGDLFLEQA